MFRVHIQHSLVPKVPVLSKIQVQHKETGDEILSTTYRLGPIFCIPKQHTGELLCLQIKVARLELLATLF